MPVHFVSCLCLLGCSRHSSWEIAMILVNSYTRSYVKTIFFVISFYKHETRLEGSMRLLPILATSHDACLLLIVYITLGGLWREILVLRCWWLSLRWNCVRYCRAFYANPHRSWPTATPPLTVQLKVCVTPHSKVHGVTMIFMLFMGLWGFHRRRLFSVRLSDSLAVAHRKCIKPASMNKDWNWGYYHYELHLSQHAQRGYLQGTIAWYIARILSICEQNH